MISSVNKGMDGNYQYFKRVEPLFSILVSDLVSMC